MMTLHRFPDGIAFRSTLLCFRASLSRRYFLDRTWHIASNLTSRIDRRNVGWYVVVTTPRYVLDCGPCYS